MATLTGQTGERLVAVVTQRILDLTFHALGQDACPTQVAFALLGHTSLQVAGARLSMLGVALGRQAKSLFGAFVGLLLGHDHPMGVNRFPWGNSAL